MKFDKVITGGTVVTPSGTIEADIGIAGDKIEAIGTDLSTDLGDAANGASLIDATGHYVIPGVLDVHVHLALPFCGTVSSDDYLSGTRAAARGGVTTLIDFAIPYEGDSLGDAADKWQKKAEG